MKNFLLIGPDDWTATDGFIVNGIKNILAEAFGEYSYHYFRIPNDNDMPSRCIPNGTFDGIIVCGTPWLWDQFHKSPKWRNLIAIFFYYMDVPKLFCGIGTCLNFGDESTEILNRKSEIGAIKQTYSNATIIVREKVAQNKLLNAKVESFLFPCPAFYSEKPTPLGSNNVLVWANPEKTISGTYWKNNLEKLNKLKNLISFYIEEYKPLIVRANIDEDDLTGQYVYCLGTRERAVDVFKDAHTVLSMRVHCAVPALSMGRKVGLIPLDSRANTLWPGGGMVNEVDDFKYIANDLVNLDRYLNKYVNVFKECFK